MAPDTLVLLTASATGSYQAMGDAIARIVARELPDIVIRTRPSSGSVSNMTALANGEADLAIVQNDVAYHGVVGEEPFGGREMGMVQALMGLHPEDVLVFVRQDLGLRSVASIPPEARVVVGELGSGTFGNARNVLRGMGMGFDLVDTLLRPPRSSLHLLATDSADVIFLTAGVGDEFIAEVESMGGELVGMSSQLAEHLAREHPYYQATTIELQGRSIATTQIRALLVTTSVLDEDLAYRLTGALHRNLPIIRSSHPRATEIYPGAVRESVPLRWHEGASRYYCEAGIGSCDSLLPWVGGLLLLAGVAFVSLWFSVRLREALVRVAPRLATKLVGPHGVTDRYRYLVIPVLISMLLFSGAFVVQAAEERYARAHNVRSQFEDIGLNENLIWMVVFTASGFEDGRFPRSASGRLVSALMGWIGIGGVILLVGLVTSDRLARRMKMGFVADPSRFEGHIVVCGWNGRAGHLVRTLADQALEGRHHHLVIVADVDHDPVAEYRLPADLVLFVRGDPTDLAVLREAGLDQCDTVIVLADDTAEDPDARTALIVLQVEKHAYGLTRQGRRKDELRTVAEVVNPAQRSALESVHADLVVCPEEFTEKLLVQAVLNPGLSQFLQQIMTVGQENQIVEVPVRGSERPALAGSTFDEALASCREHGLLLLAIHRGGAPAAASASARVAEGVEEPYGAFLEGAAVPRLISNPRLPEEREYRIRAGDSLLLLAEGTAPLAEIFGQAGGWRNAFRRP